MEFQSSVLLGVPDEAISPADDLKNQWTTNKFGGSPNWMRRPPADYPQCRLCNALLPLVAQIYCPLENSLFHRVLYIFGCTNASCWNKSQSWKVLRCQSLEESTQESKVSQVQEKDSWCDGADDWGEEDNQPKIQNTATMNEIDQLELQARGLDLSEAEPMNGLNSQTRHEQLVKESEQFVPYYIAVIEESQVLLNAKIMSSYEKKLLAEYQKREGLADIEQMLEEGTCQKGWGSEKYEQTVAKHGDKSFQKFLKRVNLCSKQCLRYSWNGEPLFMTSGNLGRIPPCSSCGKARKFEIQLMPALVVFLQSNEKSCNQNLPRSVNKERTQLGGNSTESQEEHTGSSQSDLEKFKREICTGGSQSIEFGTVYIYTCSNSCWSDDMMFQEEFVVVISDPDQHLCQL